MPLRELAVSIFGSGCIAALALPAMIGA